MTKGIAPLAIIVIICVAAFIGYGAYSIMTENTAKGNVFVTQSGAPNLNIGQPNKVIEQVKIPKGIDPDAKAIHEGTDFDISCDKTVYNFLSEGYVYCDVKNNLDAVVSEDMRLIFNPTGAEITEAYLWDNNLQTQVTKYNIQNIPHNDYIAENNTWHNWTEYKKVSYTQTVYYAGWELTNKLDNNNIKELTFGKHETKKFKFKMKVPINSQIKFDVCAGQDCLDPWISSSWLKRKSITVAQDGTHRENHPVIINVTGLTYNNITKEARLTDSSNNTVKFDIIQNGTNWVKIIFPVNITTSDKKYYFYYNNPSATESLSDRLQEGDIWNGYYNASGIYPEDLGDWSKSVSASGGETSLLEVINGYERLNNTLVHTGAETFLRYDSNTTFGFTNGTIYLMMSCSNKGTDTGCGRLELWRYGNNAKYDITWNATHTWEVGNGTTSAIVNRIDDGNYHLIKFNVTASKATLLVDGYKMTDYPQSDTASGNKLYWRINPYLTSGTSISYLDFECYNATYNELSELTTTLGAEENIPAMFVDTLVNNSIIYETNKTNYEVTVSSSYTGVNTIYGSLIWNNSNVSYTTKSNSSTAEYTFTKNVTPTLTLINNTAISSFWNFTIVYTNGTVLTNETSDTISQNLLWNYYMTTPNATPDSIVMGETSRLNSTLVRKNTNVTLSNIVTNFNNTKYTTTGSGYEYSRLVSAPVVGSTQNKTFNFTLDITYDGRTIHRNSSTGQLQITTINFSTCSNGLGYPAMRYYHYNEETPYTSVNETLYTTINAYKTSGGGYATFNFSFSQWENHTICLYPNTTNILINTFTTYNAGTTYPERHHFLRGTNISNATTNISLYSLNSTYASEILFTVQDTQGNKIPNVIVKGQRYYAGENKYRYVDMGLTDTNGETLLKLRGNDVYHVMSVYRGSTLLQEFEPMIITSTEVTLSVVDYDEPEFWGNWRNIDYSCTASDVTYTISCAYEVLDGTSKTFNLYAKQVDVTLETELCDETETGSSGTVICNAANWTDDYVVYTFKVVGSSSILYQGQLGGNFASEFGNFGIFFAVVLIIGVVFMSMTLGVAAGSVFAIVGLIISAMMNMLSLSGTGIVAIILVLCIILTRSR